MTMTLTPDMIDATVIQLRSVMECAAGIPEKVKTSGTQFLNDLDEWSEELKKKADAPDASAPEAASASAPAPGEAKEG